MALRAVCDGGGSGADDGRGIFDQLGTQSSDSAHTLKSQLQEKIDLEDLDGWACRCCTDNVSSTSHHWVSASGNHGWVRQ